MTSEKRLQKIIQRYSYKLTENRKGRFDWVIDRRTRHFCLVLEDLKNAHNISAVIRTSEVFGLQDVHIIEELNPYTVSKSILKGSIKWLNIYRYSKRTVCLSHLKHRGYCIAVASSRKGTPLEKLDLSKPTAFYMGSESLGNHPETLKQADIHFRIPQYGLSESMNVSVCAGILISRLTAFMAKEGRDKFGLTDSEKLRLKADFYERSALDTERNSPIRHIETEDDFV